MESNGIFQRMCKEAMEELASGEKGWKEVESNTLLMACFGMLTNHMAHQITRPLWFAASTVFVVGVTWIVFKVLR